jgi:uncharacterized protein YndB with AHSA1/START domain
MAKTAGISSDAVQKATGKSWDEWFALLDKAGCEKMDHKGIVAVLSEKFAVGLWWQQMVAVGYEQSRGMRVKHENSSGFSISRSKTLPVPISVAFAAWCDKRKRTKWLKGISFTIRKATENRSLRITWGDGRTSVEVMFHGKAKDKCQVSVQHSKLKDENQAAKMKAYWAEQLDNLAARLLAGCSKPLAPLEKRQGNNSRAEHHA